MKTPMQELIDDLVECDKLLDGRRKSEDSTVFKMPPNKIYEKALEKEKERMIDFANCFYDDCVTEGGSLKQSAEDYYKQIYEQNK